MTTLRTFQADFLRAALESEAMPTLIPAVAALVAQPAFKVYRNTIMKGCIDALQANYPTVFRLVGVEWFRAAASVYVRNSPPEEAALLNYGASFPEFISKFPPALELIYLSAVAKLDRLWTESHAAADAPELFAGTLASINPADLFHAKLVMHPAARWHWFDSIPAHSIWSSNRENRSVGDIAWQGEGTLITRPHGSVHYMPVSRATCAFLDTCAAGGNIAVATEQTLTIYSEHDLSGMISELLLAGTFTHLVLPENL